MSDQKLRLSQLHQIPVFALQGRFLELCHDQGNTEKLRDLFAVVLEIEPRKLESAIRKLTRAQLTKLIDAAPDLFTYADIRTLFEEYRYGVSPSFYVYQVTSIDSSRLEDRDQLKRRFDHQFALLGADQDAEPAIKELTLNSLDSLPELGGILEGNYRFLQRLGYIDAKQRAVSTFQTLYGFFWINGVQRYAIVHGRTREVLKYLCAAIEKALGICLVELVISKQLQKELPFLDPEKIQLGVFRDPDPDSDNFPSIKVHNSERHGRQFEDLLDTYPEMPQANYGDTSVGNKRTTISITEKGLFRVYGRFTAAQLRAWWIETLSQVVNTLSRYHSRQEDYIAALNLEQTEEFERLSCDTQKHHLMQIVMTLVAFKQMPGIGVYPLRESPLQLAASFGDLVKVQIPFPCKDVTCEEGHYFVCPTCNNRHLTIENRDDWTIKCSKHPMFPLNLELPLIGECDKLHAYSLDSKDIESMIEVFFGRKVLGIVQNAINNSGIQDCHINFDKEIIYVHGTSLVYHPNRSRAFGRHNDTVTNNIYNNNYSDVKITDSPGSGVGTHAHGQHID